jgi:hypothetical protein
MTIDQRTGLISGTLSSRFRQRASFESGQPLLYINLWLGEPKRVYLPMVLMAGQSLGESFECE